jgi:hypothetical protein
MCGMDFYHVDTCFYSSFGCARPVSATLVICSFLVPRPLLATHPPYDIVWPASDVSIGFDVDSDTSELSTINNFEA